MSGMSSMLCIPLYREVTSRHEPKWKRGTAARDAKVPESSFPFHFSSLRDESWATLMDARMPLMLLM